MSPGDVCRVRLLTAVRRDKKLWSGHADAAVHARRLFERMTLLPVSHLPSDDSPILLPGASAASRLIYRRAPLI